MSELGLQQSERFVTVEGASRELTVCERSVWNYIANGDLPSYKFGGNRRISRTDLEDYISRHREEFDHAGAS